MPNIVKKWMLKEYQDRFSEVDAAVLVAYQGLKAQDLTRIRDAFAENDVQFMVLKNKIARRAFEAIDLDGLNDYLDGPVAAAYSEGEPVSLTKDVVDVADEYDPFEVLGGVIAGDAIDAERVRDLSELPTRKALLGQLAGVLKAPVRELATGLGAPLQGLARGLDDLANDGEQGSSEEEEASDPEEEEEGEE